MKWVIVKNDNAFNLENISNIWIEHGKDFCYVKGKMIHNKEEVILSEYFESIEDCRKCLRIFLERRLD